MNSAAEKNKSRVARSPEVFVAQAALLRLERCRS